MHALVVTAHGSRRQASNDEVIELTDRIRSLADDRFDLIESAFLEIAAPSVTEVLENCIRKGATDITVAPYFLAGGTHVVKDIPRIVDQVATCHPDVSITVATHVGQSTAMPRLVIDSAVNRQTGR